MNGGNLVENAVRHFLQADRRGLDEVIIVSELEGKLNDPNDSEVLLFTFCVSVALFLLFWLTFSFFRVLFPTVYNVRDNVNELKSPLSSNQYGAYEWIVSLFFINDDAVLEHCGLDALCLIKVTDMGFRISMVGVFNMIWLIPLFAYWPATDEETAHISDYYTASTISNLPKNSVRLLGVTLASYIIFGFTMYLIMQEIEWFTVTRYKWFAKRKPRNYAIYINGIPKKYRSDAALKQFFQRVMPSPEHVLETHVKLLVPELHMALKERKQICKNLEHAINLETFEGDLPTHVSPDGRKVHSVTQYIEDLVKINCEVKVRSKLVKAKAVREDEKPKDRFNVSISDGTSNRDDDETDDGESSEGAFVTFTTLRSAQFARQINLYHEPNTMTATDAPEPEDIIWSNVGVSVLQTQLGKLISYSGSVALCVLWTIPTVVAVSLSSLQGLKQQFNWISNLLESNEPWVELIAEQLAPILIVTINAMMLPFILRQFSRMECSISTATVEVAAFTKLALFMIVQTFFVSAVIGGLFEELFYLARNPNTFFDVVAHTIPIKSSYFIQIVLVITIFGLGLFELVGIRRIISATMRKYFGNNITEKEKKTKYYFLRPFEDPPFMNTALIWSNIVLFMIILFVYTAVAPLVNFVLAFGFLLMGSGYRHQLVFLYPPNRRDSGGSIWINYIYMILFCMVSAEVVVTLLLVFKEGSLSASLMAPLIITTISLVIYINQDHIKNTAFLPANLCSDYDAIYRDKDPVIKVEHGIFFINGLYEQPEFRDAKHALLPENITKDMRRTLIDDIDTKFGFFNADNTHRAVDEEQYDIQPIRKRNVNINDGTDYDDDDNEPKQQPMGESNDRDLFSDANISSIVEVPCVCLLSELATGATKKLKVTIDDAEKMYTVDIIPGYESGTKIKFKESGSEDELFPAVTFIIQEEKHDIFVRKGDDLIMRKVIDDEDEKGQGRSSHKIRVTLLDGEIWSTKIPKNSPYVQHGKSLTVPNKGMPINGGSERGNLIIEFIKESEVYEEKYKEVEEELENEEEIEEYEKGVENEEESEEYEFLTSDNHQ